tara:strand:+ start:315 stop:953 length:639 start_codon:yes stop_codon:yes gene_type:complete
LKSLFNNIQTIIIVVLVVVIILLRECKNGNKPEPEIERIVKIETKYDTIVKNVPTYIPEYRTRVVTKTIHDTVKLTIDTASILEDYFATYAYIDTVDADSIDLIIFDTISQNKILSRSIDYSLIYPTTTITKERIVNEREFYVGFGIGGNKSQISYLTSELMFRTKKKQMYGIGLGINSNLEPILGFKMSWKIKNFKKPSLSVPINITPTLE